MVLDVNIMYLTVAAALGGGGILIGYLIRKMTAERKVKGAEISARYIIDDAKREAENIKRDVKIEGKDLLYKIRMDFETETKSRREESLSQEKRLSQREENLDRKVDILEKKERDIQQRENAVNALQDRLTAKEKDLEHVLHEEKQRLQRISGLGAEEAKKLLLQRMEQEVRHEANIMVKQIEDKAKREADDKARWVVGMAIQRCATEHAIDTTVSVVHLPGDEMKGRIIGREGRNIRALEVATGVDVIIDDTPEAVTLSGFDMFRREIARISLERLVTDGRIHPGRIEEVVAKVKREMEASIQEEGERVALDAGIRGLHPELIRLMGRLKYRTSYGQNVLDHLKETCYLMGVMAAELGLDVNLAKRCGILHDIGKALSHEVEGPHAKIGADLARKFGENDAVVHAIEAHHEDIEQKTIYAVLTSAADGVSGARPGARRETLESYIKRLEKLEDIAESFKGVDKSFAIQAGREVRVIVKPNEIGDSETNLLAREITKKIEDGMEYPGQIKVTVIRETRSIEYAK